MTRAHHRRRGPGRDRGFTLVEATISMLLVAVVLVGALHTLTATVGLRRMQVDRAAGHALARDLISEIVPLAYAEPVDESTPGESELGEGDGTRAVFDDVDDYEGWDAAPPVDRSGVPLPGAVGWQRRARVTWVRSSDLAPVAQETGLKRIEVTVTSPTGVEATLTALRSRANPADRATRNGATSSRIGVRVGLGAEVGDRRTSGAALVNAPPIVGADIVRNGDFEEGTVFWEAQSNCSIATVGDEPYGGALSLACRDRAFPFSGPAQDVTDDVRNGMPYVVDLRIRPSSGSVTVVVAIDIVATGGSGSDEFVRQAFAPGWVSVGGTLHPTWTGVLESARVRVSTVFGTAPFRLDEVRMVEGAAEGGT